MASGSTQRLLDNQAGAPAPVSWRVWPLVQSGRQRWNVPMVTATVTVVVGLVTSGVGWAAVSAFLITAAFWRFYVPVTYDLESAGVTVTTLGRSRTIPWMSIRRCEICSGGVLLSTRAAGGPAAIMRDRYIPWAKSKEEVIGWIRYQFGPAGPGPIR